MLVNQQTNFSFNKDDRDLIDYKVKDGTATISELAVFILQKVQNMAKKVDDEHNILWVKVADDYNSLPNKVISAYEAVYDTFNFKYLFKTDDDQILVKPQFFDVIQKLITSMDPPPHYGGYIVDIKTPHISQYYKKHSELPTNLPIYVTKYCSGRFYFLSRSAISNLINKRETIKKEYLEDYAIGFNLDQRFKTNMVSLATNTIFTDIELSDFPQLIKEGKI